MQFQKSADNYDSYGTLLGTEFYQACVIEIPSHKDLSTNSEQSFVGGVVGYKTLPRPQFSSLQQAIFPVYFSIQTALPVVLALTYPGEKTPLGSPSSIQGVFSEGNRLNVLTPLLAIFGTSLANLLFLGPRTTQIMLERRHQGQLKICNLQKTVTEYLRFRNKGW